MHRPQWSCARTGTWGTVPAPALVSQTCGSEVERARGKEQQWCLMLARSSRQNQHSTTGTAPRSSSGTCQPHTVAGGPPALAPTHGRVCGCW